MSTLLRNGRKFHIDIDAAAPNEPLEKVGEVDVPPSMDLGKGHLYSAAVLNESISKIDCAEDSLPAGNAGDYLNFGQPSSVAAGRWLISTHRHSHTLFQISVAFRSRCTTVRKREGAEICVLLIFVGVVLTVRVGDVGIRDEPAQSSH